MTRHTMWNPRRGVTWSLGVALVVLLTSGATAFPRESAARQVSSVASAAGGQDTTRRAFDHKYHQSLRCQGCHGSGASHRMTIVTAPDGCNACHHDPTRGLDCLTCHEEQLARPRTVTVTLNLRVLPAPRSRAVNFRHAVHLKPGTDLRCQTCHDTPGTLQRSRACTSCHAPHHDGIAECTACHAAPPPGAHTASVHLGCAGSGCHAAATAPSPTQGRTLCVFCHQAQREHEPGGICADCHRIPSPSRGGDSPLTNRRQ